MITRERRRRRDLEAEGEREQAVEAAPVPALRIAEAVLDQAPPRSSGRAGAGRRPVAEDEGEPSEVGGAEDARGDEGAEDAESGA